LAFEQQLPLSRLHDYIRGAARILKQGGVIAYPAEACFGLGCDPRDKQAVDRIRALKSRPPAQGFILVSDCFDRLLPYLEWDALDISRRERIEASWPGPVSWLIPASSHAGPELTGNHDTLAVRVSAFESLRALCRCAQTALVSSSANFQGQPPLMHAAEVSDAFAGGIDYIIDLPVQGLDKTSQIIDARTLNIVRD
jgi:L-threonylcarbamoyladenylate synthase